MISLVFLQVLVPFCPEEVEVSQPPCSTDVFIPTQSKLNSSPSPPDRSSLAHKDSSCTASLTEAESVPVSVTAPAFPSSVDAESLLLLPPPPSDCTPAPQPCLASVPSLINAQCGALSAEDDSCIPAQTQSDPPSPHPGVDLTVTPSVQVPNSTSDTTL